MTPTQDSDTPVTTPDGLTVYELKGVGLVVSAVEHNRELAAETARADAYKSLAAKKAQMVLDCIRERDAIAGSFDELTLADLSHQQQLTDARA